VEDFLKCGWRRENHSVGNCKCIDIHLANYPFKNAAWKRRKLSFPSDELVLPVDVFSSDGRKFVYYKTGKEFKADEDLEGGRKWVKVSALYDFDLDDISPSWKLVDEVRYEDERAKRHISYRIMRSNANTTVVMEIFRGLKDIRVSIWNIETRKFVCELPMDQEIRKLLESVALTAELSMSKDIMVLHHSLGSYFWKLNADNPDVPIYLTSIHEICQLNVIKSLNEKYWCQKSDAHMVIVFAVEDIKSKITNKSWKIPVTGQALRLKDGQSNKLAVYDRKTYALRICNVDNGEILIHLEKDAFPRGMKMYAFQFLLGKLVFLFGQDVDGGSKWQFFVLDESDKYQVLIGDAFQTQGKLFFVSFCSNAVLCQEIELHLTFEKKDYHIWKLLD